MRVFRRVWSLITTLLVVAMVFLAVALVGVRLVGLTPYTVLSGSMEPTYHVGSLIYVREIDPADVEVGMPITFVVNEDLLVATHRVVEVQVETTAEKQVMDETTGEPMQDADGKPLTTEVPLDEPAYYYTTKGDANDDVDGSPVYYRNLVGTPVFSIPYLGYLSSWLQTREGTIMGVCIALVLLILTFMPDLLRSVEDEKPRKKRRKRRKKRRKGSARRARPNHNMQSRKALHSNQQDHRED